eukprot:8859043-Prorocentrum_lima.AAC.1
MKMLQVIKKSKLLQGVRDRRTRWMIAQAFIRGRLLVGAASWPDLEEQQLASLRQVDEWAAKWALGL